MQTEEFLRLYKSFNSLNYFYTTSNENIISSSKRKSLWFKLITMNKKKRYLITS